jgi:NADP-dependent 3-hydroxy acid dehydrogenase YdfG
MNNVSTLTGKVAWIVGASSGIGLATAQALAAAGCSVVLSARSTDLLQEHVKGLSERGSMAECVALDIADGNNVRSAVERIVAEHGRIDILVNSAGMNLTRRGWSEQTTEGWTNVLNVNLTGAFSCIAAVLPVMRRQGGGLIVNIGSWSGRHFTFAPGPAYNASKAGVIAMTEHLNAEEYRYGIRACVLNPAETATPIMQRRPMPPSPEVLAVMLQPEDVARIVVFVAESPAHVCLNEITVSPTRNRVYGGALDRTAGATATSQSIA